MAQTPSLSCSQLKSPRRCDLNVGDGVFIAIPSPQMFSMTGLLEYGLLVMGIASVAALKMVDGKQTMSGRIIRAEERLKAKRKPPESSEQRIRAEVENIAMKVGEENSARFSNSPRRSWSLSKKTHNVELKIGGGQSHQTASGRDGENDEHQHRNGEKRAGAYEGIKRLESPWRTNRIALQPDHGALHGAYHLESGPWKLNEVKLRRLFEMAGMSEHIDFVEQVSSRMEDDRTLWFNCPVLASFQSIQRPTHTTFRRLNWMQDLNNRNSYQTRQGHAANHH